MRIVHECPVVGRGLLQLIRLTANKPLMSSHHLRRQKVDLQHHRYLPFVLRQMVMLVKNILHQILGFLLRFRDRAGRLPCVHGDGSARFEFCRCHNLVGSLYSNGRLSSTMTAVP